MELIHVPMVPGSTRSPASILGLALLLASGAGCTTPKHAGNPVIDGWYADPEGVVLDGRYWIFPTYSAPYDEQVFFDAFSSPDLVSWTKHPHVLDTSTVTWARRAMWAPSVVENNGRLFFFFAANDLQRPGGPLWDQSDARSHTGGIGVAVADSPAGPYRDYLGKPLIGEFHNGAQPIDPFVFRDSDGTFYLFYGGWGHCNLAILDDDFTGFRAWPDGTVFREITPPGYVEGPVMFRRDGRCYFLWSEGDWGDETYRVAYAVAAAPSGPFARAGTVLEKDPSIATGAGHNSIINKPGTDDWYIVYHRRPIPNQGRDHRVTCIDRLEFRDDGAIAPVKMTFEGPAANPLR
jgi:beta-xylosidase